MTNELRARKISKEELSIGKTGNDPVVQPHLLITILTGAAVIFLFFLAKTILNKRKQKHFRFAI
jgi:hypothetical protein